MTEASEALRRIAEEFLHSAYDKSFRAGAPRVADVLLIDAMLSFRAEGEREMREACSKAAARELDNCSHPNCEVDRINNGYSSCAGGHLARKVVKAIKQLPAASAALPPDAGNGKGDDRR